MAIRVTGRFLGGEDEKRGAEAADLVVAGAPIEEEGLYFAAPNAETDSRRSEGERPSGTFAFPPMVMGYGGGEWAEVDDNGVRSQHEEGHGHLQRPTAW